MLSATFNFVLKKINLFAQQHLNPTCCKVLSSASSALTEGRRLHVLLDFAVDLLIVVLLDLFWSCLTKSAHIVCPPASFLLLHINYYYYFRRIQYF